MRKAIASIVLLCAVLCSACDNQRDDGLRSIGARTHRLVSTKSKLAQSYFDEGLTLVYAFNRDQSRAAFAHAADADPQLAMAYWGEALSEGPNINYSISRYRLIRGRNALSTARQSDKHASPVEQDLIQALQIRFADNESETERNAQYAQAMQALARRYPEDDDVQVLAAEAILDKIGGDNLYTADHKPFAATKQVIVILDNVLHRSPLHIGANHLWIHALDASADPSRALPSARYLSSLPEEPAASHLTHMGSHIYMQLGQWQLVAEDGNRALAEDEQLADALHVDPMELDYYHHDLDFAIGAQLMLGHYHEANALSTKFHGHAPEDMLEYIVFEQDWSALNTFPEPRDSFARLVWIYAHVASDAARHDTETMHRDDAEFEKQLPPGAADNPSDLGLITTLEHAEVAFASGDIHTGRIAVTRALTIQNSQPQDEEPCWRFPVQRRFGALISGLSPNA